MEKLQVELKFKATNLRQLWFDFCEMHTHLYEKTCEEYSYLLTSELDELEKTVDQKQNIIKEINELEIQRNSVASEISELLNIDRPEKLSLMLDVLRNHELETEAKEIEKLNLVLLDIIEKIQDQNKKNQIFLNKAIISLNELRESFSGKENFKTYSSSGLTRRGSL